MRYDSSLSASIFTQVNRVETLYESDRDSAQRRTSEVLILTQLFFRVDRSYFSECLLQILTKIIYSCFYVLFNNSWHELCPLAAAVALKKQRSTKIVSVCILD